MITSQTIGTTAVVLPAWQQSLYIIHGTEFSTQATLNTGGFIDPKVLVGDEVLVVIAAQHIGKGKGNGPLHQIFNTPLPILDDFADFCHFLLGSLYFLPFPFGGVQVEKRESHVGFGHYYCKTGISMQVLFPKLFVENTHGIAHVIATGGHCVDEG